MDTRKKRSLLVEKLSRLHSGMASFNRSDENYDQCLKRLIVFAENSDVESVKVLYRLLYALPNIGKDTKKETYFSFLENFNSELAKLGFSNDKLEDDLTSNEQDVADLFVGENIGILLQYSWGCAEGATRDFSREKNVLNRYIFGFPLGKHSPLVPLSVKLRPLGNKNLTKF